MTRPKMTIEWHKSHVRSEESHLADKMREMLTAIRNFITAEKRVWKARQALTRRETELGRTADSRE